MSLRKRSRNERGSMAVEVVLLAPVLMAFIVFIIMCGRYVSVRGDVDATARDAARAASLQVSRADALAAAREVVASSLDDQTTCSAVSLDGVWGPGGTAVVHLECSVSYDGLGLIGVPGSASVDAESAVPLDPYRRYE
ncbi:MULTISPECIES: TadE/TadG family type IV pilus assembly protein [unclassified Nocardioides]|uniref:TadE/TadG family type IV pilus assembly protein n=1 Tax=unclassified Nocardioides TaxID=2615069 RepID=UPI0007001F24|nr:MULTISPECIES: TadE family protein [unclassified Nocardioides]KQY64679.1 hypothetical protein ASD30_07185 [Nocardioides sp. Root140]KQZ67340.1 hypothetical protein ASD66_20520 [Nocardioides sp. Root151]KRF12582.1 hypothetical protein ASH02_13540 [Nocardioides sp. Soil796]